MEVRISESFRISNSNERTTYSRLQSRKGEEAFVGTMGRDLLIEFLQSRLEAVLRDEEKDATFLDIEIRVRS